MVDILDFLNFPAVVATVHSPADLAFLATAPDLRNTCDLLEFRLDLLCDHLDETESLLPTVDQPLLITARHPSEGGNRDLPPAERPSLFRRFLPYSGLIDIELRFLDELSPIAAEARQAGKTIVASWHDFEKAPASGEIEDALASSQITAEDIPKIAIPLDTHDELAALTLWVEESSQDGRRVSAMGMGKLGKLSRLVLASAGSCLNFGYLREANAPGQWPASDLTRLYRELVLR